MWLLTHTHLFKLQSREWPREVCGCLPAPTDRSLLRPVLPLPWRPPPPKSRSTGSLSVWT